MVQVDQRKGPSGPFADERAGCVLQTCADYERSDEVRLQAAVGDFLLPRQQAVDDNPIRCEFAMWTPGSFLRVDASSSFNIRRSGVVATASITFQGNHRIAIDVGNGWEAASRTGRSFSMGAPVIDGTVSGVPQIGSGQLGHALVLGPFDVAPKVAVAANWSLNTGAHLATGKAAQTDGPQSQPTRAGMSLVCQEIAAACVVAAQPPELEAFAVLSDPRFAA
jgi:hypothetical protein